MPDGHNGLHTVERKANGAVVPMCGLRLAGGGMCGLPARHKTNCNSSVRQLNPLEAWYGFIEETDPELERLLAEKREIEVEAHHRDIGINDPSTGTEAWKHDMHPDTPKGEHHPISIEVASITGWWRTVAEADLQACLPKLAEYGSNDLVEIGRDLCALAGWENPSEQVMAEVGVWFYLRGKIGRTMEALIHHRLPSDDTVHDITVYSMMIRRIRRTGQWGR